MKKSVLILAIFVMFAASAAATTYKETTLRNLGYPNFDVEGVGMQKCTGVEFLKTTDLNFETQPIFSVHAEFLPVAGKQDEVNVFFNNSLDPIAALKPKDFVNGWARVTMPFAGFEEKNHINICVRTGDSGNKIVIHNDSIIGYYAKADFEEEGAFYITVTPASPDLLDDFRVDVVLKNYGVEDANVVLKYRKDYLERETPETQLVKGKTILMTRIDGCTERDELGRCTNPHEVTFAYYLRPKIKGMISLLPAVVEYTNPFGETTVLESNRPDVIIREPEIKVKAFVQIPDQEIIEGQNIGAIIIVTNEGARTLQNIEVKVLNNRLGLGGSDKALIDVLEGKETKEFPFTLKAIESGKQEIGCTITYLDQNLLKTGCTSAVVEVKKPYIPIEVIAGALLTIAAAAFFAYLYWIKK